MIETDAVVTAVEGDRVLVEAGRRSACGHCDAAGACGGSVFAGLFGNRPVRVEAKNEIDAQVGDRVIVSLPERTMMSVSLRLYLLPLFGLFLGAVVGEFFSFRFGAGSTEPWAVLGGLLGLTGVLFFLRRAFSANHGEEVQVVILRKVSAGVAVEPPELHTSKEQ